MGSPQQRSFISRACETKKRSRQERENWLKKEQDKKPLSRAQVGLSERNERERRCKTSGKMEKEKKKNVLLD